MKIKDKLTLLTIGIMTSPTVVSAEDTMKDYEKYVPQWLKDVTGATSAAEARIVLFRLAGMAYDIFFILSVLFFGYKFLDALYLSFTRSQHSITKNQLVQEVFEPIKGLGYFIVGLTIIKLFAVMIFPVFETAFSTIA